MSDQKRIIEINGVKFEVDTRQMKRVDRFRVGDRVKVLTEKYGDTFEVHSGVIVGFTLFEKLPTATVVYLDISYSETKLIFLSYNSKSKDVEIAADYDETLQVNKGDVLARLDNEVENKKQEIEEIERKKAYFLKHFEMYFSDIKDKK